MENADILTCAQLPKPSLPASPRLSGLKSSAPNLKQEGSEKHLGHPSDFDKCTFAETVSK